MREWLVIECAWKHAVFADHENGKEHEGFIPRDVVEGELGIKIKGSGLTTWFSREDGLRMRAHPAWRTTAPPGTDVHPALGFWALTTTDTR
jgi:hypothetical protein